MEKRYNKQELDREAIPQLRDILKTMKLKVSGKKEELIDRILSNQPKEQTNIIGDYISLLPMDITKMVQKYRIENNPNNIMIKNLLDDDKVRYVIGTFTMDDMLDVKEELEKIGIPINITVEKLKYGEEILNINYSNVPLISDNIARDFLYFLIKKGLSKELLNFKLREYNTEYRIIIFAKVGYVNATDFDIMKVKYI